MARFDEQALAVLEVETERDDPRFARGLGTGRPCRPREYRFGVLWVLILAAPGSLVLGLALKQALLVAGSVMLAAVASRLHDRRHDRPRSRPAGR